MFYTRKNGLICARVRIMLERQWLYVFLTSTDLVDVCLPGDLLSVLPKLTEDQKEKAVCRARRALLLHERVAA